MNIKRPKLWLTALIILLISAVSYFTNSYFFNNNFSNSSSLASNKDSSIENNTSLLNDKISTKTSQKLEEKSFKSPAINRQTSPSFKQHSKWQIKGKLNQQIERLASLFTQGDLNAGYSLAMNLKYCLNAPLSQQAYDQQLELAQSSNESIQFIDNLTAKFDKCQGIEPSQTQQFYHYLHASAEQGLVAAQEQFSQITAEFFMTSQQYHALARDEYIATRDNFIKTKLDFLIKASEHGSLKAMVTLSNMYHSQNYGAKGRVKAHAYNQVILNFTDNNKLYRRYQWYIERSSKYLSPEELALAQKITDNISQLINNNGTLYRVQ